MNDVLVVVAHPDDAELAVGGTIKLLVDSGAKVTVLNLTISEKSQDAREKRIQAAERAALILGYDLQWYENGRFDHVSSIKTHDLVGFLDRLVKSLKADAVFSHWQHDSHNDHIITAKAVLASSRSWNASLYAFPPNELKTTAFMSFVPNVFVDVSAYMQDKMEAIRQYSYPGQHFKPLQTHDFKHVNRYNGVLSNCEYAEAFLLVRQQGLWVDMPQANRNAPSNRQRGEQGA